MDLIVRVNYKRGYEDLGAFVIPLDDYEDVDKSIEKIVDEISHYPNVSSIKRVCLYEFGELVKIIKLKKIKKN